MGGTRSPNIGRQWQFSWEALSHLRILRLYLMHPSVSPIVDCLQLTASLCSPDASFNGVFLLIKWNWAEPNKTENSGLCSSPSHPMWASVRVPVPPVVLDHSIPLQWQGMSDHIEVKLVLMLPVDHPLMGSLSSILGGSDGLSEAKHQEEKYPSPFSLDNDVQALATQGEVHFYCKNCSKRLTKEPLRFFKELPSADWRDVADNWFGTCCCSFGGVSQKLVNNFEKFSSMSKGTCFVGRASITVRIDKLERDAVLEYGTRIVSNINEALKISGNKNGVEINTSVYDIPVQYNLKDESLMQTQKHINKECERLSIHNTMENVGSLIVAEANIGKIQDKGEKSMYNYIDVPDSLLVQSKVEDSKFSYDKKLETIFAEEDDAGIPASGFSGLPCKDTNLSGTPESVDGQFLRIPTCGDPTENCKNNCCTADSRVMVSSQNSFSASGIKTFLDCCHSNPEKALLEQTKLVSGSQNEGTSTFSFYLENGFMMGPSCVSNSVEWIAVHCSSCLSLIGSYPDVKGKSVSDRENIQLFKCHISTSEIIGGPCDIFRRHTLQGIFVNQLQANAEDESSYRTVVRDLKTQVPMLQMVLVNTNAWFCSGECLERIMRDGESASKPELLEDGSKGTGLTNAKASKDATCGTANRYGCANMKPVVKVFFHDCSSYTKVELRAINEWALQKHAEDIFMLEEVIKALREALHAKKSRLPSTCSSLDGFYLSFLERE